ncbi:DUF3268 family zinc-finger domain-containing protein [Deltaproteobacteria bacterium]|nr:DUF3268 family zinc-finger domain-containing protein [Deltaproteobacteria bacterium]
MPRQVTIQNKTYTEAELDCPECGKFMVLATRTGGVLYYRCSTKAWSKCSGSHSCHQADARPLGIPGDAHTKHARMKAHKAFDQLWKKMGMKRKDAYRYLQRVMAMTPDDAHIGRFTEEQCEDLLAILTDEVGITLPKDIVEGGEGFVEFGFDR